MRTFASVPLASLLTLLSLPSLGLAAEAAEAAKEVQKERTSLLAPPRPRGVTRVHGTLRPFLSAPGLGFGMLSETGAEYYFRFPLKLGVDIKPLAFLVQDGQAGLISHVRGLVAYSGDFIEVGVALGGQVQHFGASGMALAATLRLGSLDGLNLLFENGYSLIEGHYGGQKTFALDHFLGEINVPLSQRLRLNVSAGYGLDLWLYGTVGLRHYLRGRGERGTLILSGGLGGVVVVDRFACHYGDPAPCEGSARGYGPTISVGLDARL